MEKWDLYNAKREKSGITMCRGEIIPKGLYHLSVSVWIVNQQGQYLLSQRHPKKQYPLYWECTGGSVFSGETSLQGAIREVKEELGILLTPGSEKLIYQTRRENVQDFYDVWLFHTVLCHDCASSVWCISAHAVRFLPAAAAAFVEQTDGNPL